MNYASGSLRGGSIAVFSLVVDAARCWREARDTGQSIPPPPFTVLAREGYGILAPVFDSLMHLYEFALRRPLQIGISHGLSEDEDMLLDLLSGSKCRRNCLPSRDSAGCLLDCAIESTRIMISLSSAPAALR